MEQCLWSAVGKLHGVNSCVKDRRCKGIFPENAVQRCNLFIGYKGKMELHREDFKGKLCIFIKGSTDDRIEKSNMPAPCKGKRCNGIDEGCETFMSL